MKKIYNEEHKKVRYGLRNKKTGTLVSFYATSNGEAEDCVDIEYRLEDSVTETPVWLVEDKETAEYVLHNSTPWFNAEYSTPWHTLIAENYEVVKVTLNMEKQKEDYLSPAEVFELLYGTGGLREDSGYYNLYKDVVDAGNWKVSSAHYREAKWYKDNGGKKLLQGRAR